MKITLLSTLVFLAFATFSGAAAENGIFKQVLSSDTAYAAETSSVSNKKKKHKDEKNGGKMGTQIIIHGCGNDPTEHHGSVLNQCFVDSYGTQLGYTMKEAKITKEVDVADKSDEDGSLRSKKSSYYVQYLWGYAVYSSCGRGCPNDEDHWFPGDLPPADVFEAHLTHPSAAKIHAQFEEAFCACLVDSGLTTYKTAYGCDVKYAYFLDSVGMEPFDGESSEIEE